MKTNKLRKLRKFMTNRSSILRFWHKPIKFNKK